jgi:hypothetical protein
MAKSRKGDWIFAGWWLFCALPYSIGQSLWRIKLYLFVAALAFASGFLTATT